MLATSDPFGAVLTCRNSGYISAAGGPRAKALFPGTTCRFLSRTATWTRTRSLLKLSGVECCFDNCVLHHLDLGLSDM